MGIYIKGMRMPKQGYKHIVLCGNNQAFSLIPRNDGSYAESGSFEAFDITPHGRLGDLDALAAQCDDPHWCVWLNEIEDAPTIIEAEE